MFWGGGVRLRSPEANSDLPTAPGTTSFSWRQPGCQLAQGFPDFTTSQLCDPCFAAGAGNLHGLFFFHDFMQIAGKFGNKTYSRQQVRKMRFVLSIKQMWGVEHYSLETPTP